MIVAVNAIHAIAYRSLKKNSGLQRGLNPRPRDTGAMLYRLSYETTDVGSRSIVGSYVPVKEMRVNDIWNKSYMNWGNEMKMKKLSSQWTQFIQLRKEAWKQTRTSTVNGLWTRDTAIPVRCSLRNCINCVHCDNHFFIFISFPQFIYDFFHTSLTVTCK